MMLKKREYVVVSVGGSLIVPDEIDTEFLSRLKATIERGLAKGLQFYIIAGGGKLARRYQEAGAAATPGLSEEEADWLGIHATRMNAHLVRSLFLEHTQDKIVKNPTRRVNTRYPIVVAGGWRPGNSTDYCAVMAAKTLGAKKVINLSNIDYVYTADPRKDPNAKKIEKMSWAEFRKLIPEKWEPGLSSPFDPVAAKEAEHLKLEVACLNGAKLEEFEKYLNGESFIGSVIS